MSIGIYCIENTVNKNKYVGQSINLKTRISQHRTDLRGGYHYNYHLQKSFNKYGENSFKFYIIKECPIEFLDFWERWYVWINKIRGVSFNFESGGHYNKKVSEDTKKKLSIFHKGKIGHKHTEEHKKHVSEIHRGKVVSDKTREKISKARAGVKLSYRHRTNIAKGLRLSYQTGRISNTKAGREAASSPDVRKRAKESLTSTWAKRKELAERLGISAKQVTKDML